MRRAAFVLLGVLVGLALTAGQCSNKGDSRLRPQPKASPVVLCRDWTEAKPSAWACDDPEHGGAPYDLVCQDEVLVVNVGLRSCDQHGGIKST